MNLTNTVLFPMNRPIVLSLCIGFVLCLCLPAHADSIVVGLPLLVGTGNCIPFGCQSQLPFPDYQQIYTSSAFSGPVTITGINFFETQNVQGAPSLGTYSIFLSTTNRSLGSFSQGGPVGADNQLFFSGTLPAIVAGTLAFTGTTPFNYDPGQGNLLLDVQVVSGATSPSGPVFLDQSAGSDQTTNGFSGGGLVTEFITTPSPVPQPTSVPEPSSLPLLGTGLGGITLIRWRRKSQRRGCPENR